MMSYHKPQEVEGSAANMGHSPHLPHGGRSAGDHERWLSESSPDSFGTPEQSVGTATKTIR